MSATVANILIDLRDTLRSTGDFQAVTLGPDADASRWPRAEVILIATEEKQTDDAANSRWLTVQAQARVYVRSTGGADALQRALVLAESAEEALLADRFRGQRCQDLPTGKATQLGPVTVEPNVKAPHLAVSFEIRCRFEEEGS